jgi:O-antigen/teichoic acid export membrane protein
MQRDLGSAVKVAVEIPPATENAPPESLARRSATALKWSYLGVVARIAMQLVSQIVLARLLGPDAFGIIAAATLVLAISSLVSELGLGAALVQTKELSALNVRAAFTKVLLASSSVALGLYFLASWISTLFGNPDIALILRWMLPSFMLQALSVVSLGLLKRKLDFKSIQIAQSSSYFFGFLVVGVGCAILGAGAWSLVAAWTVQNLLSFLVLYTHARHGVAPALRGGSRSMGHFGRRVVLTNMANWVIENIDNVVIGKVFGTQSLGSYSVAYSLVRTPANHAVSSIQQVMFPASARSQNEPKGLAVAYMAAVWGVGLITFPVFIGIAAVSDTVVAALYGAKWNQAALLLLPLALAMPLHAVMALAGPMLWGRGEVGREFKVQALVSLILVAATIAAAMMSPVAVAWAVFAVYLIRAIWLHAMVADSLGVPFKRVLAALSAGLGVATLIGLILLGCDTMLRHLGFGPLECLLLDIATAAFFLLVVFSTVFNRLVPRELAPFISLFANRIPKPIAKLLRLTKSRINAHDPNNTAR